MAYIAMPIAQINRPYFLFVCLVSALKNNAVFDSSRTLTFSFWFSCLLRGGLFFLVDRWVTRKWSTFRHARTGDRSRGLENYLQIISKSGSLRV